MKHYLFFTYYRLSQYYGNNSLKEGSVHAYISICSLFLLNLLSVFLVLFHETGIDLLSIYSTENKFFSRFIRAPIYVSPIFLFFYFLFRIKKRDLNEYFLEYTDMSEKEFKKRTNILLGYIIGTILALLLSALYPLINF